MIHCSSCGKPIDKLPAWLATAKADFICNNCPNRTTKNIAFVSLEMEAKPTATSDDDEEIDIEGMADDQEP